MKKRLLIIGCGDVGRRLIPLARRRYRVYALMRDQHDSARIRAIRELGATPIIADLDAPQSLRAIAGIGHTLRGRWRKVHHIVRDTGDCP